MNHYRFPYIEGIRKRKEKPVGEEKGVLPESESCEKRRECAEGQEGIKTLPTDRLAPNPGGQGLYLLDLSSSDMLGKPGSPKL